MARITSFEPHAYNQTLRSNPELLIAPPYDVITPENLSALHNLHPDNITHLTLPEGEGMERYERAGTILAEWLERGVLERRPDPAIYPYTQTFAHPETGDRITRSGFIVALHLEPFSSGTVLPHERTLSGPREDRLSLMQTTGANLEAIFGMYPDPNDNSLSLLNEQMSATEPLISVTDQGSVEHKLWEITDPGFIESIVGQLASQNIYIVDGHHRYETALNYRNIRRAADPNMPENHPVDSIMIYLSPMSDPGLVILPTHRIIHSMPNFDFEQMLGAISPWFTLTESASPEEGFQLLHERDETITLLLMVPGRSIVATLKSDITGVDLLGNDIPKAVAELDVSVLHIFLLERLLGVDKEAQESQRNLRYAKSTADAIAAVEAPGTQLVVGMNPPRFSQVEAVAESGEVMPQKSTYFYPKLASGLLINKLD